MEPVLKETCRVSSGDFASAGNVSAGFKRKAKQLGLDTKLARMLSVAAYESELNLVIHSLGGELTMEVYSDRIVLKSEDYGPGIPSPCRKGGPRRRRISGPWVLAPEWACRT